MISKSDKKILNDYVKTRKGWNQARVDVVVADYTAATKNCKCKLNDDELKVLRDKWHITEDDIVFNILGLMFGQSPDYHVYTMPDGRGRRHIVIDPL